MGKDLFIFDIAMESAFFSFTVRVLVVGRNQNKTITIDAIESELDQKVFMYAAKGKLDKFKIFFVHNEVICRKIDESTN